MNAAVYALAAIGALYLLLTTIATALVILAACLQRKRARAAMSPRHPAVRAAARREAEARALPARKPQAAPWPDGDTIVTDGMADAINRMLRGDQRG